MSSLLLQQARLLDGTTTDVLIVDGVVAELGSTAPAEQFLDLGGRLLLTAPAEPHAHLDKAGTAMELGDATSLAEAVALWSTYAADLDGGAVVERAVATLRELVAHGVTAVRTHANLTSGEDPLVAVKALVAVRELVRASVDVQVVALPRHDASEALLEAALDEGADLLGGGPHLAPDPAAAQGRLIAVARRRSVALDLHTDETTELGVGVLEQLADAGVTVTASHCVSLGRESPEHQERVAKALAAAGVSVVTLPQTNLWLQGRGQHDPTRGLTAVRVLLDAGVTVAAGGDNVQDPFNPLGRCDPFETAGLLVVAAHVSVAEAWHAVSEGARSVMGLPAAGPQVGLVADLVAIQAGSLRDAIARAPEDRIVIKAGRIVAGTRVERAVAF